MYSKDTLLSMNQLQVRKIASDLKIDKVTSMPKSQLVEAILAKAGEEKSEQDVSISEKRGRGRPKKIMPAEIRLAEPQQEFDASCDVKEGVLDLLPDEFGAADSGGAGLLLLSGAAGAGGRMVARDSA